MKDNEDKRTQNDRTESFVGAKVACDQPQPDDEHDERLVAAIEEYIALLECGEAESIETFANRHGEVANVLVDYLKGVTVLHAAVESARDRDSRVSGQGRLGAALLENDSSLKNDSSGVIACNLSSDHPPGSVAEGDAPPREIGDYRVLREVGRGGMGVVYEAEEQSLRRRVALKVLPFAAVLDQRQIARFRNEAQAAAALHHPNIVPVFAIGQERGVHYYAMQYIEGQSLAQATAELRRVATPYASPDDTTQTAFAAGERDATPAPRSTPERAATETTAASLGSNHRAPSFFRAAAQMAAAAADALEHAHEQGVVHRDIKPSNLLIDGRGKVWVADFGLARMQTDLGVTATGDVVGTLRYMSPEQARGRADQVDGRTDVYALGATLYELLTLRHAHPGDDRRQMLDHLERVEPTAPRRINPAIPLDLESIVLRALEKDRDARYASAAELRDDLQRFLDGRPTVARPPTVAQRVAKWTRRRQRLVATAAAALAAVTLVAVVGAVLVNSARQRAEAAYADSERHRARAERLLDDARRVLDRFGGDLSDQLAAIPGAEPVRSRALEDTLAYYRVFLTEAEDDPRLAVSAAETRVRAAAVSERLGRSDEALTLYDQAIAALTARLAAAPADDEAAGWLARAVNNHALLRHERGETEQALEEMTRAVSLRRGLLDERPRDPQRLSDLAAALSDRAGVEAPGDAQPLLDEAITLLVRAQRIDPDDPGHTRRLAVAHNAMSSLLRGADPGRAAEACERAIELLTRVADDSPEVDAYRDDLAIAYSNRGALAAAAGRWDDAAEAYGEVAAQLRRLAERAPLVPRRRSELAVALAGRGFALARGADAKESDRAFDAAQHELEALVASYPASDRYRRSLAALLNNRGVALRDSGRLDEAAVAFARAGRLEEQRLARPEASSPSLLAVHYANHAQVLGRLGRFEEAALVETKRRALLGEDAEAMMTETEPETQR